MKIGGAVQLLLAAGCLLVSMNGIVANGFTSCTDPECVKYDWYTTTVNCVQEIHDPANDCRWPSGMNSRMDELAYGGRIVAYQLQWFSGGWSNWFVPGMNDMDSKFNIGEQPCSVPYPGNGLRKAWAYFTDHTHKIIICR